jgi:imidazolonepropionase-like amidohydrolase
LSLHSPAGDTAPPDQRVRASARAHLDIGVLALREPGSPDRESLGLGPHEGLPRVVTAGRFLAPTGQYFPGLAREVEADQLPDAAVAELQASGSWVKIIGDTPLGDELHRTYDDETLAETARRVHALGGRIAVHCVLPETIHAAVHAGFDSLEHGSFLQLDQVVELAQRGIAWVPTQSIDSAVRGLIRELGYTQDKVRHVEEQLDRQPEVLRAAVDAGVTVLAGTDAGMVPHGLIGREVEMLIESGVPTYAAIGSASWAARSWLGLPGIEEGAPADLVAYRENPLDSPDVLTRPVVVILDGQLIRDGR